VTLAASLPYRRRQSVGTWTAATWRSPVSSPRPRHRSCSLYSVRTTVLLLVPLTASERSLPVDPEVRGSAGDRRLRTMRYRLAALSRVVQYAHMACRRIYCYALTFSKCLCLQFCNMYDELSENRFGAQATWSPFSNFSKTIKQIRKKNIHVANNKIYKSANFHRKIPCISGSGKKTNMVFSGNTGPIQNWPTNS
jgi:hypothetical protein